MRAKKREDKIGFIITIIVTHRERVIPCVCEHSWKEYNTENDREIISLHLFIRSFVRSFNLLFFFINSKTSEEESLTENLGK